MPPSSLYSTQATGRRVRAADADRPGDEVVEVEGSDALLMGLDALDDGDRKREQRLRALERLRGTQLRA